MRLFVAIELPEHVRQNLADLLHEFRAISPQTKWVRPENMHLTLKFLGETASEQLNEVKATLHRIYSSEPIELEFRGLGFFPNARRPRVLWAGIESSLNLSGVATEIDQALHKLGFPLDDRTFTPHLTLARFSQPALSPALQAAALENASRAFGAFFVRQFQLIESKLKSAGAEYTTLQSFSFAPEA
jgi:2'-5' RNA ligase